MKLQEIFEDRLEVLEEVSKDGEMILTADFVKADEENLNHRLYPEHILKNAIQRLQKKIEKDSAVLSSAGHKNPIEINHISHLIQSIWFDEKRKTGRANIKIIPTSEGKNVQTIIKNGGSLGLSLRGIGTTSKIEGVNKVNDDFELLGVDIVTSPGFENARFSQKDVIGESLDLDKVEESTNTEKQKVERFMKKVHELYLSSREAGMKKMSLRDFVKTFESKIETLLKDED